MRPDSVDVVVLCAGLGTRLKPLTDSVPKALVPIAGRPLLAYHLKAMKQAGIRRVVCVVGYLGDRIREYVGDGTSFGLKVQYASQPVPNGTGGAVLAARDYVRSNPFAVLYADVFFQPMGATWASVLGDDSGAMLCAEVRDTSQFGRVITGDSARGGVVKRVVEKDGRNVPGLMNAGLLLLPKKAMGYLEMAKPSPRGEIELPAIVEPMNRGGEAMRVVSVNRWTDIGTLSALEFAQTLVEGTEHT